MSGSDELCAFYATRLDELEAAAKAAAAYNGGEPCRCGCGTTAEDVRGMRQD